MTDLLTPLTLLASAMALLAGCAVLAAALQRRALGLVYPLCLVAAAPAIAADVWVLLADSTTTAQLPLGLPNTGLRFRLDSLGAFFGLTVNLGAAACALYGLGLDRKKDLSPRIEPFFPAFIAAMNAVLIADDAFGFLFFWELMSVTSWIMVLSRHKDQDARHAAHVYLIMANIGTMALLFAFGALAGGAGSYDFQVIRTAGVAPHIAALALFAVLIGAGSKAGIMPLHAWLPLAHPAAPSHVSALMSGVMTKVAIYGLIRVVFDLIGGIPAWWWSLPFILLGAATAVGALLYAVLDTDLKRVLAYSTVENIGIIYVGLGLAIAFKASGLNAAGAVAMTAALLHVMFHSWYKSLLFLGAGAILHATGRRDFDGLGGLIHAMPRTAVFFLIGALAISALPPLNGFVSEWLLFQAVLAGPALPEPTLRFLTPAVGGLLALSAALAAACFVRVYGIIFLGRPRSFEAATAHEAPLPQTLAMGALAVLCGAGGLLGGFAATGLSGLVARLSGLGMPGLNAGPTPWALVAFDSARSTYDAPIIAFFAASSATLTAFLVHWVSNRRTRRAPAWDCGFPDPSPATQYTASSFSQPLRRVYGTVAFSARENIDMPEPGDLRPARLVVATTDHIWQTLYVWPARAVIEAASRLNVLQFLTIRRYLVLMFCALLILLLITAMRV